MQTRLRVNYVIIKQIPWKVIYTTQHVKTEIPSNLPPHADADTTRNKQ